jgi:hypothetical protein
MPLAELKSTVEIIAGQLEHFDGTGYPHGNTARHISVGARILALARDYDSLQLGTLEVRQLSRQEALEWIRLRSSQHYDPQVVHAFLDIYRDLAQDDIASNPSGTRSVKSRELVSGMVLSRDMSSPTGLLLLTAGHVLDEAVIRKIHGFERSSNTQLSATVWTGPPLPDN